MTANHDRGRLVILSGPSCAGKSPLHRALARFYPEHHRRLRKLVLYNSRAPRPGEVDGADYHFRPAAEIEALKSDPRFAVLPVRGDIQALDLEELPPLLAQGNILFEGNPYAARLLQTHPALAGVPSVSIFLSPLSREEILFLKDPARRCQLPEFISELMRRKLLRRGQRLKGVLALPDLEDIERRAGAAFHELQEAVHFDWVLPNHDGEESENWEAFYYPIGDARRALLAFVELLEGRQPALADKWEADLMVDPALLHACAAPPGR